MNEENFKEIETYKYLLKITEDLLVNGGYPKEILNKYYSLKEISLSKFKDCTSNNNNQILLNEENELSFTNHLKEKDFEILEKMFDSLYESICATKRNLQLLNIKENNDLGEKPIMEKSFLKLPSMIETFKNTTSNLKNYLFLIF